MKQFGLVIATVLMPALLASQEPAAQQAKPAREDGLYATIQVSHGGQPMGAIVIKLFERESPITVRNFVDLALGRKAWTNPKTGARVRRPLYNGLTFHRVIPGFMIQGGDPLGTGMGGTDVIKDEFHPTLKFDIPGRVAMANAGPNTGSCQFFITEVPTPHLNGKHTIFGQVVEGQELVGKIARVPRDSRDKPTTPVVMTRVTIERVGPTPQGGIDLTPPARPAAKKAAPAKPAAGAAKK